MPKAPVETSFGSVARGVAVLATKLRRFDDAQLHFETALAKERSMGARPWLAHAQHDYARMLLARGDTGDAERALALIADAVAAYSELGREGWARSTSELERAVRVGGAGRWVSLIGGAGTPTISPP